MERGKADFKALREDLGLSQQDVACAAKVSVATVKKWERPGCAEPPNNVWEWLEERERIRSEKVDRIVIDTVLHGDGGCSQLVYFRTQEQHEAMGGRGPYGAANADARLIARTLRSLGFETGFAYPDERRCALDDAERED